MSYAGDLSRHYAQVHRRLIGTPPKPPPKIVIEAPEPTDKTSPSPQSTEIDIDPRQKLSLKRLLLWVAQSERIPVEQLLADLRTKTHNEARFIYCYLARKFTDKGTVLIGRVLTRDHTSIINAIQRIPIIRAQRPDFDSRLARYETYLAASLNKSVDNGDSRNLCLYCPYRQTNHPEYEKEEPPVD